MRSTTRMTLAALACLFCACGAARPALAQTSADTAALARATAALLGDSILSRTAHLVVWQSFDTPFDSAVAENLRGVPELGGPVSDPRHAVHMGVRSVTMGSDTALVLVESWQQYADTGMFTFWNEQNEYLFQRTAEGWRYVRRTSWRHGDGGSVRGR